MFGAIRSQSGSSPNEFKFTGEQVDSTGLQYLRARYYDPAIGRFLSQDPVPGGNLYAYVGNNPVLLVDPYGLFCIGPDAVCDKVDAVTDWAGDNVVDPVGAFVTKTVPSISGDVWNVLRRFGTLNCLSAGIGILGTAAILLAPEFAPGIALGTALAQTALFEAQSVAFASSAAINFSQIDRKEGSSMGNLLAGVGATTSGIAHIGSRLAYAGGAYRTFGVGASIVATGVSVGQCARDVF